MRYSVILLISILVSLSAPPAFAQDATDDRLLTCGYLCSEDGEPLLTSGESPPDTGLVIKIFIGAFSEACAWAIGGGPGPGLYEPEVYDLAYRPAYAEPDEPDEQLRLYRFFCGAGAYNERHVYLTWTADAGVQPVSFALPTVAYDYVGGNIDTPLRSLSMTGMHARQELVNSTFDAATGTVTEWSCWRGLCDASSRGEWRLDGDTFRLVAYDVDPTYDGEVNLFRVADFSAPVAIDISQPLPFEPPVFDEEEEED